MGVSKFWLPWRFVFVISCCPVTILKLLDGYCKSRPINRYSILVLDVIMSPNAIIPVVQQMVFSSQLVFHTYHMISSVFLWVGNQLVIPGGSSTACHLGCFWLDFNSIVKLFHIALPSVFFINSWTFQVTGLSKGFHLSNSCSDIQSVTNICAWIVFGLFVETETKLKKVLEKWLC